MSKPNAKPEITKVKLTSARVGHNYDKDGRRTGVFSQPVGAVVDMPLDEAERYLERGLATLPDADGK